VVTVAVRQVAASTMDPDRAKLLATVSDCASSALA